MDKIDKAVWNYILENGGLVGKNSYYGGLDTEPFCCTAKGKAVRKEIEKVGIDWKSTKPATDGFHREFAGTFAERDDEVYYVCGTLVLNNGKKYNCQSIMEYETRFLDRLRQIVNFIDQYVKD
jgi:hypothetical protein